MNSDSLYEDGKRQKQHLRATLALIEKVRRPGEEITRLYYLVLQEYEKEGKIKTFLPILISKRVKEMIEAKPQ